MHDAASAGCTPIRLAAVTPSAPRSAAPRGSLPVLAVVLSLVLAGCSVSADDEATDFATTASEPTRTEPTQTEPTEETERSETETETAPGRGPTGSLARFYGQPVAWEKCPGAFECGTVEVPVDYTDPDGKTLELAVNRRPADGNSPIGALIVNPGGPGASGVDYAPQAVAQFGPEVLRDYDVVGFDPRGVAASEPVECLDDPGVDRLLAADPDPDTDSEVAETERLLADFAAGCAEDAGALLPHLSTTDVARDLDVLRAVMGDDKLHYYGASYGTFIGAVHAELFPDRVGRVVLDGAVDPSLGIEEVNRQQAAGFETALRAYVEACVGQPECPLGDNLQAGVDRVGELLDELDAEPLQTGSDRELTQSLGLYGVALPLYVEAYWPVLDQALTQALDGDGAALLALADAYWGRTAEGYKTNTAQAIYAVNCLDDPSDATVADIEQSIPSFEQVAPTFGRTFAWSPLACAQWPVEAAAPVPDIDGEGAAPILVVGTTRDPATPYEWAQSMADQLESGVLLTRDGDGHTAYGQGNECIDSAVDRYLVEGTVPPPGKRRC